MLTQQARNFIKREIDRTKRERLPHEGRLTARGRPNDLKAGSTRPWFPVAPRKPGDHHRILPSLDWIESQ